MTTASRAGQTRELAEFVSALTLSEIPELAADRARTAIADVIGVALAGRRHHIGSTMLEYVADQGAREVSGILGGGRTTPELAGLANGTFAHAMDFDDSNHPLYGHPSCHLVPAILAVGEECGASFGDALTAYIAGFEVDAALAGAMNMAHYETDSTPPARSAPSAPRQQRPERWGSTARRHNERWASPPPARPASAPTPGR